MEADFHEHYGIDLCSDILRRRDGRWFRARLAGLLCADTRLARRLGLVTPLNVRHLPIGGFS